MTASDINQAWATSDPLTRLAFAALTVAMIALWFPLPLMIRGRVPAWAIVCAVSVAAALPAQLVSLDGVLILAAFAAACGLAGQSAHTAVRIPAHLVMLAMGAGLLLHAFPGFENPRVLDAVRITADAAPYTKYLSFDKGVAGLFLLGLYAPQQTTDDPLVRRGRGLLWRFAILIAVVMVATLALGYARWEPKLVAWWPQWIWSMVFLTALPEEAIFRGVAQHWLDARLRGHRHAGVIAAASIGVLFGVAHLAGGWGYVVLAALAGFGYGWIYASTGSIAAAIAAHAGLNTLHFLLFTYPAVAASVR